MLSIYGKKSVLHLLGFLSCSCPLTVLETGVFVTSEGAMSPQWYHCVVVGAGSALWNNVFIPITDTQNFQQASYINRKAANRRLNMLFHGFVGFFFFFLSSTAPDMFGIKCSSGTEDIFDLSSYISFLCPSCPLDDLIVIIFLSCTLRSPLSSPAHLPLCLTVPEWRCWHSVHGACQTSSVPYINHRLSSFSISLSLLRVSQFTLSTCSS